MELIFPFYLLVMGIVIILTERDSFQSFFKPLQINDHTFKFRNINCQSPGSSQDAAVFQRSKLYNFHDRIIPNVSTNWKCTTLDYHLCNICILDYNRNKWIPSTLYDNGWPSLPNIAMAVEGLHKIIQIITWRRIFQSISEQW